MSNPNHNASDGRFSSGGAADGDHQAAQTPNAGHGAVVTAHAGQKSVGTHLSAKQETIAKGQRVDDTRYPPRSNADVAAMTDRNRLQGSQTATPGRFKYQRGQS